MGAAAEFAVYLRSRFGEGSRVLELFFPLSVLNLVQNPDCVRDFAASPASPVAAVLSNHQILAIAAIIVNNELRFSHIQIWPYLQARQHETPTTTLTCWSTNFPPFWGWTGQSTCAGQGPHHPLKTLALPSCPSSASPINQHGRRVSSYSCCFGATIRATYDNASAAQRSPAAASLTQAGHQATTGTNRMNQSLVPAAAAHAHTLCWQHATSTSIMMATRSSCAAASIALTTKCSYPLVLAVLV